MADRMKTYILRLLSLLIILLSATLAGASSGGEHVEMTFLQDWLPRLVNFGLLAVVLVILLRKPVRQFFSNRTLEIKKAIEESKEARERAILALDDIERKLKDAESEANRMVEEARARGEKDKEALSEEGAKVVQEIQAQAKSSIDIEVEKARAALAVEASLLALDLAEGKIKETMDKKDQDRIMKDYISRVGGTE